MAAIERQTLPVPYGHHVYVVSDLSLSPTSSVASRPLHDLIQLLDVDDPATIVVAGNLFHPDATADLGKFVDATLDMLGELRDAMVRFAHRPGHRLIVLAGRDDHELAEHEHAQASLAALGILVAKDLVLQVTTASGVRDIAVAAGECRVDTSRADAADRADADRLEDPPALARFVASRVLYRRLAGWVWFPVLAMAGFDLLSSFLRILNHFTHENLHVNTPHTQSFWNNLALNLMLIAAAEALVVGVAGLIVRRRFQRSARSTPPALAEPLSLTTVEDVDALELARRVSARQGAGAVVGGAPRPALAFLDRGVCASPGPSRTVVIERHGRLGLPPVFTSVERLGIVEIEAASAVQVHLYAGESPRARATMLERLVGGAPLQPSIGEVTTTVGSWPTGDPFPLTVDRLRDQRAQRSVRRLASGLLFLDGLVNVVVSAMPPLRSRLHLVESILPLGIAKSAAAITAVAGAGMIMMARGIRRGQRRAWFFAVGALATTTVAHLARAGSVASSLIAILILGFLVVRRENFQATTDRSSLRGALPRLALIGAAAVLAATLGIEASQGRHHLPSFGVVLMACLERLVGQSSIVLPDRIGDFINPTLLTVGLSLIVWTLYLVTRPVVDRRLSEKGTSAERRLAELRAREIVRRHGRGTLDYFALRDDKQFFFYRDSLVAYAVYGGVALVSPDPIGPVAERTEVFSAFRSYAESRGWTIGIVGAGQEWLPIYLAAGLHYLYLGDEAIVNCTTFSLEGGKMKGLRQACTRLARKGYTVEFLDPSEIDPRRVPDIMELISMLRRGEGERGFSMMLGRLFNAKDKGLLLTLVHGPDGKPAAVCQFVPSPAINGYSLDLMRRDPGEHPNGLIDFALCSTIEHLRAQGARGLSLNFAAFRSVLEGERGEGTFTRVERWALRRLSGILPIESLWSFNAKYHPTWLPRHLVYPAAESFVPVVAAVLRAESITELPVLGRFLTHDPSNRPGTVVPEEVLEAAKGPHDLAS
ncbi:MAG TPA: phosphatidylglycerol lysyltransferase domain-containing protein [Acidimicrobiales bacterium]|nr:phosphatidylglycerol lysyltransferase domain-containing protein [Acidimicrobiales bacterium]